MDIIVRGNDINKVVSRYFSSSFLGSSSAKRILGRFFEFVNKLDIETILQTWMNGPNVNWSFLRLFQETYEKKSCFKAKKNLV